MNRPIGTTPTRQKSPRLPAKPLLTELEYLERLRQQPLTVLLGGRIAARAFYRARAKGTIALDLAETWCEELLGYHPATLYGTAWDAAAEKAANQHTMDAYTPGTRAAYDRGCRCPRCRAAKAASRRAAGRTA